ncbi:MAG: response regulator [Desulfamplus sp.]
MFWTDKSAKFIIVNNAASKTLGYSREELLTMNIFDIDTVLSKEKWEERWEQIVNLGSFIVNTIHKTKDGRKIPVELTINLVEYGDKQYNCAIARDITERKQAEEKQKELEAINLRLQKAESLSQMAGGIAHLFNNYLYAVSGNLEMAIEELPDDSLIRKNLAEAMKAARRCADVSGSMLTYLGQNIVKHESLDILECCRKAFANFQSQLSSNSGVTIETDLMEAELLVRANSNQMQQVLNHLIINACESIGDNKGRISLTTKTISASYISKFHLLPVDCKPSADTYVCLEVTDTGCGISKEDIHKLSDPFFTTKFTGRGLGLAIISGIVKSWGGCIGVKSKVGHGSSFMVFLPIYVDNSVRQLKKLAQSPQPQQKEFSTVLLVEDHEMVRNMTTVMLEKMGFEVISAVNGVEAVELFRKHKESVSCLITDLSMPELDGWGTLAEIRKIKPDIPAILASGYDEAFAMSRDDLEKPQAFLHKPYSMKELKSAIEQAMDSLFTVN